LIVDTLSYGSSRSNDQGVHDQGPRPTRGGRTRGQQALPEPDQRWSLSRRLLHDAEFSTVDRVAGCLVLLYGQPCTRIATLTTAQVTDTGQALHLMLGTRPVEVPNL
jgi:hypothetical protein